MTTYYAPSGNPTFDSPGLSASLRAEFILIANGIDSLSAATEGTSTTSLTIETGTKVFTTAKQFVTGQFFSAISAANSANYMHGTVVSYIIPTLTTSVSDTGGSGTFADWNLSISGSQGAPGAGITPQAVGFTATGGTSSKTLTVALDANVAGTNTGDETTATIKTKLGITTLSGSNTGDQDLSGKQASLVSGTNIKTINSQSLLGSGNLVIAGGGGGATNLGATLSATNIIVTSDTGTDATLPAADVTNAGLMTPAQFTKLGGPSTIDIFATQPVSPIAEQGYFNSTTGFLMLWTGVTWAQISGVVGTAPIFLPLPILTIDSAVPSVIAGAATVYIGPVGSGTTLTIDAAVPSVSVTATSP